jgi:hypothetical protein
MFQFSIFLPEVARGYKLTKESASSNNSPFVANVDWALFVEATMIKAAEGI